jgi:AraC-like DNA-binding protein
MRQGFFGGDVVTTIKVVNPLPDNPDAATQSLLALGALAAELAAEGVSVHELFDRTGIEPSQLEDPQARMSHRQRLIIYRNAQALAKRTDVALLAGARQRLSDYGIYGYAMMSSATFGDALLMSLEHITMAGPAVKQISFSIEDGMAILRSHGIRELGDLMPFVAEFWRSSMTSLFSHVLGAQFPAQRMVFTYPPPPHWRHYERMFNCQVDFNGDGMEWYFDAAILDRPCPNANPITARVCQQFCDRVLREETGKTDVARRIRAICLNRSPNFPAAEEVAAQLGMSLRTLHRRLSDSGLSYQAIIDDLRRSLAVEFLQNTRLQIEQVAERVGFADAVSFRKAFRKWTGHSPGHYRTGPDPF